MEDVGEPSIFSRKSLQQPVSRTVSKKEPTSAAFVESFLSESGEEENNASFEGLGLAEWLVRTCRELGMKKPTPVQQGCVSQILAGKDVFGLAQTGSGKTAAFALPILQKLAENPYGVYALVLTPTRELAFQISDQFKALGSGMNLRNTVVIGGMDMTAQAKALMQRPHVVIATPGRMRDHLTNDPDIAAVFARTKFLVLDEADRLLEVGFEQEIRVVLENLPSTRQTLLFSATMTSNLQALHELSMEKAFFYQAYEGFKTVETLQQEYLFIPANVKDVYLMHVMSTLEDREVRSVIIFASSCR
jgi:ATP-dependent RNA helicase DDX49/DBP8